LEQVFSQIQIYDRPITVKVVSDQRAPLFGRRVKMAGPSREDRTTNNLGLVKPVFIRSRDLPWDEEDRITTREICGEAENVVGHGTMEGAQRIGGLWRVYPKTQAARMQLLVSGLSIRKNCVRFSDENPFLVKDSASPGGTVETTKVYISNIPISFANTEIEEKLVSMNCKLVSKMIDEYDRDTKTGKLTRWKTGRRFVFIAIPPLPLPAQIIMGAFTARLYHREQKTTNTPTCGNCLQSGHKKHECKSDIVCRTCQKSGHKSGDALCGLRNDAGETTQIDEKNGEGEITRKPVEPTSGSDIEADDDGGEVASGEDSSSNEANKIKALKKRKKHVSDSKSSDDNNERSIKTQRINAQPSPVTVTLQTDMGDT
jgi:hypothetical protein